ncbi:hypothetical protein [Salmonirosea aquatica]|uniref:Uncharacterized protein n=1 Tax=Salmonirosea aquatica TaxID=2654236 RepID=A0A7C9BJN0_9BACT|nr:hypothetical protein [Cytophagaceae bacterium SJW1-29]
MSKLLISCMLGLTITLSHAQTKTRAFFMVGDYSQPEWEKLAFEVDGTKCSIMYAYRKHETGYPLKILGVGKVGNAKALRVSIPGFNKTYLIYKDVPKKGLVMVSEDQSYRKFFALGYEGPVNGVGTFCASCANEPAEAFALVDSFLER